MLQLKNISKRYKTANFCQNALKNFSVSFKTNEFVAVLGPSGSGKSTLLNILGGLDRYDSGDLIINGKSTKKFNDTNWDAYRNNCIGFVFQNYNLISHISILNNVEMGMTLSGISAKKRRQRALKVLKQVRLEEHAHKKPNQLSGGQMQRVAIARALVNNPSIILADEPTGALDSNTSIQIMELIKEIANEKLVIMVTHNSKLAYTYATRIIELEDGELRSDSNPVDEIDKGDSFNIKKTSMSFLTALKLSLNNLRTKIGRTLLTSFASSIGIIGIALILSLSNGFDKQIDEFEANTLRNFPISISYSTNKVDKEQMANIRNEMKGEISEDDYKNVDVIYPYDSEVAITEHVNKLSSDYVEYIKKMDNSLISAIGYYRLTGINLLNKKDNEISSINSTSINLTSLPEEFGTQDAYLKENYDLLYGKYPNAKTDVVLMVDSKNRVDYPLLEVLGFNTSNKEIKMEQFIGKEFKLILNDNCYKKITDNMFVKNEDLNNMYENSETTIKIVGVMRPKQENSMETMKSAFTKMTGMTSTASISYRNELIEYIIDKNSQSEIVKAQEKSDGVVFMGGISFDTLGYTKEQVMSILGAYDQPLMINLFPYDFNNKDKVVEYLDKYNVGKKLEDQIIYTDYADSFSELSGNIMNAVTYVLLAFSGISLIVSSIMIGIITYISVLERTKEIGILRALGARKKDITRVFNAETFIIGLISGALGILITLILLIPTNIILESLTDLSNIAILNPIHAIILIVVSLSLTLLGGFIPAKLASKKDPVIALRTE
ncbi:MAG: ABC transporter ATP-binding protein/permease [Bacilli bacterium]|nr:ABC transporter ATP-binding protein/permease [Bacilli bacterium]MDD4733824.1 ABC transporter ATP-binding protein/permease [Bacilli bacterium]